MKYIDKTDSEKAVTCKYCNSEAVVKFGKYKGIQRYFCKLCRRKFKADTHPFHMKTPAEYIIATLNMYYRGMRPKQICENLKLKYNYYPPKSLVHQWVKSYINLAVNIFKDCHPNAGDTWVACETVLGQDGKRKVWVYDVIDDKNQFLLASNAAVSPTARMAQLTIEEAVGRAGKIPRVIITDENYIYPEIISRSFGDKNIQLQLKPLTERYDTELVERFTVQIDQLDANPESRERNRAKSENKNTQSVNPPRSIDTFIRFIKGWLVYYNFFKPQPRLGGRTPAEKSEIDYEVKNWADLVNSHSRVRKE